jgi:hypothetical protein
LDKVIRDWYRDGNVTNLAMTEAKPFDDQFDVVPEGSNHGTDIPNPDPPKAGSFGAPSIV